MHRPLEKPQMKQPLPLLSLMSLQFLHPFRQLDRRAFDYYCFIYMYHKPIVKNSNIF